ncbi:MAG: hypothetical protein JGK12_19860 [Microcoleus sp. PH2017_01_SCD_O_A]|uniref:hypothetical protein n=1 Tax=unclassified Microcoleus TaxID=2642155 RepID=UPI001DB3BED4|nr:MULTISPECIES: hypothetical protein [unclassified Microcoleus]MCC3419683.1 hypothetical protein [Microcoleus sp. PH2017_07_MST_O_A]MCC3443484.1 hypothetical protein [Microcoleus sp. PH2017_03_ELD_O_A]MCC3503349.1 hypothetical protein [Microcoleus sp. PH2017_19_SFW_U_A]MCC3508879.1 hypothetical protein [Microcoleus sp. PH2017_17_BER_D_A]MCC3524273.1 hypothetical protein [Microcoleus sp. PH2017_20_SFW_D_A]MCC3635735.1 hypothetical protein [Microcoleus sp. PH2017_37_MFU_D_B]
MSTDQQTKVSMAMPVYNGDRHICQAPNFRDANSFSSLSSGPLRTLHTLRFI